MPVCYAELKGPKVLPILGNLHQIQLSKLHKQLEDWSSEFGPVFKLKLSTNTTVVSDPEIINQILRDRPETFIRMKKMDGVLEEAGVKGVFNVEGESWKMHRKLVAKGLDVGHQQQFFPSMIISLNRLFRKWNAHAIKDESFDVQKDLMRFTVDVTTTLAFGYEMNTIENDGDVIQQELEKIFPVIFSRINAPVPYWRYFKLKKDRSFDEALLKINGLVDQFIHKAQNKLIKNPELKEKPTNFLEAILVASESDGKVSMEDIRSNLITLLLAGEDTTAHTVAWIIYLISGNKEIQKKIQKEVDELIQGNIANDYNLVNNEFKYITAVAMEAMRLKPVAPLLLFESKRDVEIKGYLFKKGDTILTHSRFAGLQPEYFVNPESFNPERWLIKGRKRDGHNEDAFTPFGGGPRFCPGRNLAFLEIKLLLSMLMKNFDVEIVTPANQVEEKMAFTMMASPYNIKLKPRL